LKSKNPAVRQGARFSKSAAFTQYVSIFENRATLHGGLRRSFSTAWYRRYYRLNVFNSMALKKIALAPGVQSAQAMQALCEASSTPGRAPLFGE
jgi:hypothetical protein